MSGILRTIKNWPLSTPDKKNRNGRIYSRRLWENVLNSEYWKDMISNKSLCGEIVHPGDRTESDSFEIDARNVSHRITEAHFDGGKLMGTVEVLDTPQGRTLESLINAGCVMGISARGVGDMNGDEVDPDTYNFKTFDITFRPSDFNARMQPLTESEGIKFVLKESEISDTLIEGYTPSSKHDRYKGDIINELLTRLKKKSEGTDFNFDVSGNGIQVFYKDNKFGNIFISQVKNDDNNFQTDKYGIFTNKDKSFGYEYVPSRGEFDSKEYDRITDKLFKSFNSKILKDEGEIIYSEGDDIEALPDYDKFIQYRKDNPNSDVDYDTWYNNINCSTLNSSIKLRTESDGLDRDEVIEMFNQLLSGQRNVIKFSKGYKVFEDVYNAFTKDGNKYSLHRNDKDEIGYTLSEITIESK